MKKSVIALVLLCFAFAISCFSQNPSQSFPYDSLAPLGFRQYHLLDSAGCRLQEANFNVAEDHIADALFVRPLNAGSKKQPLVIFQHWGGGNKTFFRNEAILLAQNGFSCVSLAAPWLWTTLRDTADFFYNYPKFIRLSVTAIKRLIDSFSTSNDIDKQQIFFVGHSYGGTLAGLLAGVEPRIKSGIIMAGLPSISRSMMEGKKGVWKSQWQKDSSAFLRIANQLAAIEPEKFISRSGWHIFHQIALHDEAVSRKYSGQYLQATRKPYKVNYYNSGHVFDSVAMKDRISWIVKQSSLPVIAHSPTPTLQVDLISIVVTDLKKSSGWYQTKLGFTEFKRMNVASPDSLKIIFLKKDSLLLELVSKKTVFSIGRFEKDYNRFGDPRLTGFNKISFRVQNINEWYKRLNTPDNKVYLGLIEDKNFNLKTFILGDPDGNLIQFVQYLNPHL